MAQVSTSLRRPLGPQRFSENRGLTLVEVIAAAFVLVFAITSSVIAMQAGFRSLDNARGVTLSSQILQSEIESLRLLPWGKLTTLTTDDLPRVELDDVFKHVAQPRDFELTHYFDEFIPGEMLRITVTVSWKTIDGLQHTRSTSTEYSNHGLNDYYATKH